MKKYFIILLSLFSIVVLGQRPSVDSLYLKPQIGYIGKTISSKTIFGADSSKFETKYSANKTYVKKMTDSIQFKINSLQNSDTGTVFFDGVSLNIRTAYDGVIAQVNREIFTPQPCKNTGGVIIQNGAAVRITGAVGNNLTIAKASFSTKDSASGFIGLATMQIGINEFGIITTYGSVGDLNTSMYDEGDTLYLSYNGTYTTTKPTTGYIYRIGTVTKAHNTQGTIFVNVEKDIPEPLTAESNIKGTLAYSGFNLIDGTLFGSNLTPTGVQIGGFNGLWKTASLNVNGSSTLATSWTIQNGSISGGAGGYNPKIFNNISAGALAYSFSGFNGYGIGLSATDLILASPGGFKFNNNVTIDYTGKLTANGGVVSTGVPLDSNYIKFNKLNSSNNGFGENSLKNLNGASSYNNSIGSNSCFSLKGESSGNTVIGHYAFYSAVKSSDNIIIGKACYNIKHSAYSTLAIDNNSDTLTTFIHGDMFADTLRINAQTRIGKGVNYTGITARGNIELNGTAKVWNDVAIGGFNIPATTNVPAFTTGWAGSSAIGAYYFQGATQNDICYFNVQIPHNTSPTDSIRLHIHGGPTTTPVSTDTVVFLLTYSFAEIGSVFPTVSTTTTKIPLNNIAQWQHQLVNVLISATGTGSAVSPIYNCSLQRLQDNTSDTYTGNWGLLSIDCHAKINSLGSKYYNAK